MGRGGRFCIRGGAMGGAENVVRMLLLIVKWVAKMTMDGYLAG